MVAPVPAQLSSPPRNVPPSTLNSFRIPPVATGLASSFKRSSLPYPTSSPNPRRLILLQTLLHSQKPQPLWNQANPNSLCKTRGVGGVRRLRASVPPWQIQRFSLAPLFSYSYKSLFPQPLSFHIHANPPGCFLLPCICTSHGSRVTSHAVSYSCHLFRLSLRSFLHSFPLFSIACSLFSRNTRGWGYA
jgi:hypothetical protein